MSDYLSRTIIIIRNTRYLLSNAQDIGKNIFLHAYDFIRQACGVRSARDRRFDPFPNAATVDHIGEPITVNSSLSQTWLLYYPNSHDD